LAYFADATRLESGSIIKIEKPISSSGKPTYPHFFVVLSVPDTIIPGNVIPLVGISSRVASKSANPKRHISMKWLNRSGGDPETGLDKPCYACVEFSYLLEVYRGSKFSLEVAAEHTGKFIRAEKLQTLAAAVNAWTERNQ
jgi:hypothetical protein